MGIPAMARGQPDGETPDLTPGQVKKRLEKHLGQLGLIPSHLPPPAPLVPEKDAGNAEPAIGKAEKAVAAWR